LPLGDLLIAVYTQPLVIAAPTPDNQAYVAQRERLFEGMRKAGVPEG
jgi:hypothetical protein